MRWKSLTDEFGRDLPNLIISICGGLYGKTTLRDSGHNQKRGCNDYIREFHEYQSDINDANLRNYCIEGLRKVDWVVNGYERYHRTVSSLINALIGAGFMIEECQEAHISDEMRKQYPALFGGTIHRPEFIFFRCRKDY